MGNVQQIYVRQSGQWISSFPSKPYSRFWIRLDNLEITTARSYMQHCAWWNAKAWLLHRSYWEERLAWPPRLLITIKTIGVKGRRHCARSMKICDTITESIIFDWRFPESGYRVYKRVIYWVSHTRNSESVGFQKHIFILWISPLKISSNDSHARFEINNTRFGAFVLNKTWLITQRDNIICKAVKFVKTRISILPPALEVKSWAKSGLSRRSTTDRWAVAVVGLRMSTWPITAMSNLNKGWQKKSLNYESKINHRNIFWSWKSVRFFVSQMCSDGTRSPNKINQTIFRIHNHQ